MSKFFNKRQIARMMGSLTVVDAVMGGYKTTWSHDYINALGAVGSPVMYVTPFLKECDRAVKAIKFRNVFQPDGKTGSKRKELEEAVMRGNHVVITHELFLRMTRKCLSQAIKKGYILILDEVIKPIESIEVPSGEIALLEAGNRIQTDDEGFVNWGERYEDEPYCCDIKDRLRTAAQHGKLRATYHASTKSEDEAKSTCEEKELLGFMKTIPFGMINMFEEAYVLTYLYKGSVLKGFIEAENHRWVHKTIQTIDGRHRLVDYKYDDSTKKRLISLINLHDKSLSKCKGRPNDIERKLSYTELTEHADTEFFETLIRNLNTVFGYDFKAKNDQVIFTIFKALYDSGQFKPVRWTDKGKRNVTTEDGEQRLKSGFVSVSSRATNKYQHITNVAYLVDRHPRVSEINYIRECGGSFSYDTYSLSEMIQFIWRSAIRNFEPINLYIPSMRMRALFKLWLHTDYFETLDERSASKRLSKKQLKELDEYPIGSPFWYDSEELEKILSRD